ncbi:hypothetical protein CR513_10212, partial [Mucuna pruriens]
MGSNCIRVGHLIISSLGNIHFGQGRVKGYMRLKDSNLLRMYLKVKQSASLRQFTISGGPSEAVSSEKLGVPTNHELQQYATPEKHERHHLRPQDANRTVSKHFILRSGKELPQPAPQQLLRSTDADSQRPQQDKTSESDEELLRMFWKVEINIPLLDAIKQIPKYAKFLKELCVHKRKKMKGGVEVGGIVSALTRNEDFTTGAQQALPKKFRNPGIFSISCTIGDCTLADAMLDLGASINVMPTSIYKSLNFGDLEPTKMTIYLANRSIVQPLGVLEDVLVQVNELIFLADFYVLNMEDKTSGKGSTLILGRPFLMTTKTKIDVLGRDALNGIL